MPIVKTPEYPEWLKLLRKRLPDAKVQHCVFVAEYLSSFGPPLGLDHDGAVAAGLLHDLCRALSNEELLERANYYGLRLTDEFQKRPVLLHGPVAAEECRDLLGIESEDVYEAICWHTTGTPGLGLLGQALYVADFAEPSRRYPEAGEVRTLLRKEGFEAALRHAAESKLGYLRKKGVTEGSAFAFAEWVRQGRS